jgi:hypothetical protein
MIRQSDNLGSKKTSVRIYCSLITVMAVLCFVDNAHATVDATTPFTSVEAHGLEFASANQFIGSGSWRKLGDRARFNNHKPNDVPHESNQCQCLL